VKDHFIPCFLLSQFSTYGAALDRAQAALDFTDLLELLAVLE